MPSWPPTDDRAWSVVRSCCPSWATCAGVGDSSPVASMERAKRRARAARLPRTPSARVPRCVRSRLTAVSMAPGAQPHGRPVSGRSAGKARPFPGAAGLPAGKSRSSATCPVTSCPRSRHLNDAGSPQSSHHGPLIRFATCAALAFLVAMHTRRRQEVQRRQADRQERQRQHHGRLVCCDRTRCDGPSDDAAGEECPRQQHRRAPHERRLPPHASITDRSRASSAGHGSGCATVIGCPV